MAVGSLDVSRLTELLREMYPEEKYRQFIDGDWSPAAENIWAKLEDDMPENEFGPRVIGGSKPGEVIKVSRPGAVVQFAERSYLPDSIKKEVFAEPPEIPKELRDHVEIEFEVATRMVTGFNIFLAFEGKTAFLPVGEVRKDISSVEQTYLDRNPQAFMERYQNTMIATARKRFREGKVESADKLVKFKEEHWMTPEQVQVLVDLRAECG